jgi:hypothetical protein
MVAEASGRHFSVRLHSKANPAAISAAELRHTRDSAGSIWPCGLTFDEPSALAAGFPVASPNSQSPWLADLLADIHPLIATNPIDPFDINGDGALTPLDGLASINDMNAYGVRPLFAFSCAAEQPCVCNFAKVVDRSAIDPLDRGAIHDNPACHIRGHRF